MTTQLAEPARGRGWRGVARRARTRSWGALGLGALLVLGTGAVFAQPPEGASAADSPSDASSADAPADAPAPEGEPTQDGAGAPPPAQASVHETQARLERSMQELEASAAQAQAVQSDDGGAAAGCMDALRLRGSDVMEVATGELLVLNDGEASSEAKAFAHAKLEAAAAELEALASATGRCFGEPGSTQTAAENKLDEPRAIPSADPTLANVQSPVPPPVDIYSPVTVASPSV